MPSLTDCPAERLSGVAGVDVSAACRESGYSTTLGVCGDSGVAPFNLAISSWAYVISSLSLRLLFLSFSISNRVSGEEAGGGSFFEFLASDLPADLVEVFLDFALLGRAPVDSGSSVPMEAMSSVKLSTS